MSRKPKMHQADRFCREIINRHPKALELFDTFFNERAVMGGGHDWCALKVDGNELPAVIALPL